MPINLLISFGPLCVRRAKASWCKSTNSFARSLAIEVANFHLHGSGRRFIFWKCCFSLRFHRFSFHLILFLFRIQCKCRAPIERCFNIFRIRLRQLRCSMQCVLRASTFAAVTFWGDRFPSRLQLQEENNAKLRNSIEPNRRRQDKKKKKDWRRIARSFCKQPNKWLVNAECKRLAENSVKHL